MERECHETLHRGNAKRVVSLIANQFVAPNPTLAENFRTVHYVSSFKQADMTASNYIHDA